METETLEKKIAKLPDELRFKVEGFVDELLIINSASENPDDIQTTSADMKIKRGYGSLKGKIWMSDDFDEPLEEFKDYM